MEFYAKNEYLENIHRMKFQLFHNFKTAQFLVVENKSPIKICKTAFTLKGFIL